MFLLILVVALGDLVAVIPMAALVAVMIMVSVGTFDWHSVRPATLRRMPLSATVIMLATAVVTVATHNLAYGVVVGVVVACLFFARRVARFTEVVDGGRPDADTHVYLVRGALFFASSNDLVGQFDYAGDPGHVVIDSAAPRSTTRRRRGAGLDRGPVPPARHRRADRRPRRAEPGLARPAERSARRRPLTAGH